VVARGAAYGLSGVVLIFGFGRAVPEVVGMGRTFLTTNPSLLVSLAIFWVGGWGLARDIDLEADLRATHARAEALAREAEHAQLLALRSHFDPHFLFNTLNAIAEWCRVDGAVAEKAIVELSAMLRTVMSGIAAKSWPLSKELELVDTLFGMYLLRDPELFVYRRDVPTDLPEVEVPPMILLPVAENAMKHGPSAGNRGDVVLRIAMEGASLAVTIENPGAYKGPREGGSGLPMIRKRLALTYDESASFEIRADGARTVAKVVIPKTERSK
jgi:LytS/YehU family sensor histidine kinase